MVDAPKKQEYKGPSDFTYSMGQSMNDGYVGAAVGGVAGAVAGAVMHKPQDRASWHQAVEALEESKTLKDGVKNSWKVLTRGGKALVMGLVGAAVIGQIGQFVGVVRGISKAKEARAQFEEITGENATLRTQLEASQEKVSAAEDKAAAAEKNLEATKSFVSVLQSERAQPKKEGPSPA